MVSYCQCWILTGCRTVVYEVIYHVYHWPLIAPVGFSSRRPKTRGGTLEASADREENFAVPEKISIFENIARKGLPKSTQRIAESLLGIE